ncbi:MAG TPA: FixH family protein [Gammaproteobacteria bacterium]|nr:FixH family protein [Gammaproteobacteria bacterium]
MNAPPSNPNRFRRRYAMAATVLGAVAFFAAAAAHAGPAGRHRAEPPARSEFGLGPRVSAAGHYTATLQPAASLRQRELQSVRVRIADAEGHAVDGATIEVDGGMPQHGHGLPTRPRVTKSFGEGLYEIEGVRFNMGGWWVFSLAITGSAGTDKVTFNIQL